MTFVANTENMGQLVSTLGTASRNIEDRLAALQSYGDRLKSTWTGPAGDAYEAQKQNWDRAAATMNELLSHFGVKLNAITDSILQTERTATNRWNSTGAPAGPRNYSPVTQGGFVQGTAPISPRLYDPMIHNNADPGTIPASPSFVAQVQPGIPAQMPGTVPAGPRLVTDFQPSAAQYQPTMQAPRVYNEGTPPIPSA